MLAGCATVDPADPYAVEPIARHLERDDDVGYCARLFADIDRRVDALAVRDAEAPRIAGFPYLRVDRLTAALAPKAAADGPPRKAWLARLAALDDAGRTAELANAIAAARRPRALPRAAGAADAPSFDTLKSRARVPDAYSAGARALGLYPLTQFPVAAGVARWQDDTRAVFALPLEQLPVRGRLMRFGVRTAWPVPDVTLPGATDALGLPVLSRFDRTVLLVRHAPLLEIDVQAAHDRPGEVGAGPGRSSDGRSRRSRSATRASLTRCSRTARASSSSTRSGSASVRRACARPAVGTTSTAWSGA